MILDKEKLEFLQADSLKSNKSLADTCGLSVSAITQIKRGANTSVVTAGKIAAAFGVSVREIVRETKNEQ
jgi:transcriptional regulator with XRE-family HTH domain